MKNIEKYIEEVNTYINNHPSITEDELIRYVYLDLGNRLSFNVLFTPFGNSRKRKDLYEEVRYLNKVDKCLETNVVICNTASSILAIVLSHFGVDIEIRVDSNELISYPHVYNSIQPKDGRKKYSIDLQDDMCHIQMHGRTPNYGINEETGERVISYFEQEQIDRRIGYVSDNNYYTDDFLYTLKLNVDYMDNIYDKLKFILENIEVYENPLMGYTDRQWYHVRILEYFFDPKEFNYHSNKEKIRVINCYKDRENSERIYVNCIVLEDKGKTHIFVYNKVEGGYREISVEHFFNAVNNGLLLHNSKIREIEKRLRKSRNENIIK